MLAASALGVFLGRMVIGTFISGRFSDLCILAACYSGAMAVYGLLLLTPGFAWGVGLFFLCGALLSAQAPTMYSIASSLFGSRATIAIPLIDAVGMLGGAIGPILVGGLADRSGGLHAALWLVPVAGVLLVVIVVAWEVNMRTSKNTTARPAPSD